MHSYSFIVAQYSIAVRSKGCRSGNIYIYISASASLGTAVKYSRLEVGMKPVSQLTEPNDSSLKYMHLLNHGYGNLRVLYQWIPTFVLYIGPDRVRTSVWYWSPTNFYVRCHCSKWTKEKMCTHSESVYDMLFKKHGYKLLM